jgi:transposase
LNGLLAVDAHSGQEYIKLTPKAKTEDLVDYFYDLALQAQKEGFNQLTLILDNNSTHKDKMRYYLWLKLKTKPELLHFRVNYLYTPTYSPNFNLAEYIIHLIRLNLLHHLPANVTLDDIKNKISNFFLLNQLQTPLQILNTINHILKLGGIKCLL